MVLLFRLNVVCDTVNVFLNACILNWWRCHLVVSARAILTMTRLAAGELSRARPERGWVYIVFAWTAPTYHTFQQRFSFDFLWWIFTETFFLLAMAWILAEWSDTLPCLCFSWGYRLRFEEGRLQAWWAIGALSISPDCSEWRRTEMQMEAWEGHFSEQTI